MISKPLRIASVSDIHLGHNDNPADEIADKLIAAFPDNEATAVLDIIAVVGDLFDKLLTMSHPGASAGARVLSHLLRLGKKYNIAIRVLEGTPLHDWKQSALVLLLNQLAEIGADLKYVDDLAIEHIEHLGITVLYVPDMLPGGPENTLSRTKQLLIDNNLEQVDFAFMHGCFKQQLPTNMQAHTHDEDEYLNIVKHQIFIGHHHTFWHFMRIIAQGSFDRLTHGQEEAKGHVRTVTYPDGDWDLTFVENKDAMKFITVRCAGMTPAEAIVEIDKKVENLPVGSYVRIMAEIGNPILVDRASLIRRFPGYVWKLEAEKDKTVKEEAVETVLDDKFIPIHINEGNVSELLLNRLVERHAASEAVMVAATLMLQEAKNDIR